MASSERPSRAHLHSLVAQGDEPFAEEARVTDEGYAHGIPAGSVVPPPAPERTSSRPPAAGCCRPSPASVAASIGRAMLRYRLLAPPCRGCGGRQECSEVRFTGTPDWECPIVGAAHPSAAPLCCVIPSAPDMRRPDPT